MSQITNGIRSVLSVPIIYDTMQNLMGAHKARRELVTKFIRPEPDCRILDIGCGTAEILQYIPNSVEYWGYDIHSNYIAAAKKKYNARGHFHCGQLNESNLKSLPKFDIVLGLGLLHHLNDGEAKNFFSLAKIALLTNGRVVTIDPCLAENQSRIARYLIMKDRGQNVRNATSYTSLAKENFSNTQGALKHRKWIPYTHWIMECQN